MPARVTFRDTIKLSLVEWLREYLPAYVVTYTNRHQIHITRIDTALSLYVAADCLMVRDDIGGTTQILEYEDPAMFDRLERAIAHLRDQDVE